MTFYINAWLDRAKPFLSICDRSSGKEVVRFEHQELSNHLQSGDLCLNDFCSSNSHDQQMLVRELMLLRCCYTLRSEINAVGEQLAKRTPKILPFPRKSTSRAAENDQIWSIGTQKTEPQ